MAKLTITSWPNNILKFVKESRDELKKVSWPSRQTTVKYTLIVIISSVVVGMVIGAIDYGLVRVLEQFIVS